jgi:hypothetical protein
VTTSKIRSYFQSYKSTAQGRTGRHETLTGQEFSVGAARWTGFGNYTIFEGEHGNLDFGSGNARADWLNRNMWPTKYFP